MHHGFTQPRLCTSFRQWRAAVPSIWEMSGKGRKSMPGADLIRSALAAALLTFACIGTSGAATPNVVVFLADDMGWGDLHANNPASRIPTPNLDRLAREGMRFTNAHTSAAKCAPSRYSILTGNYQWRGRWKWGAWQYYWESQIRPGQMTVGDIVRRAGYRTGYVGKLHMGGDFFAVGTSTITRSSATVDFGRGFANGPRAHGFDYSFALLEGIQDAPYAYFENDSLVGNTSDLRVWPAGTYGNSVILLTGPGMPYWNSSRIGPDLMGKAIGFIDAHLAGPDAAKPFLLYYAAQSAHEPYTPPATFDGTPIRGATGMCARQDMIYEADVALGRLHEALRTRGLLEDTLIVFTSDNGGLDYCGQDSSGPNMSGYKGQILEGGHRVPLIVKWGQTGSFTVPAGTVRRQLVGAQDLAATLAGIVGVDLDPTQARDSFDLSQVWLGQRGDTPPVRGSLIAESRDLDLVTRIAPTFASIEGPWKLVAQESGTGHTVLSLHNLKTDPKELTDIKDDPAQAKRVRGMLTRFLRRYAAERTTP
jgi:arylsulfatase A-like enzyme